MRPALRSAAVRRSVVVQADKNPFAALGNMGNMMDSIKKAQAMVQEKTRLLQKELEEAEIEGFSGDETVRVVMSGSQRPLSVDITEEAYKQGSDKLEKLVTEAMQDAHLKSTDHMRIKMQGLSKDLGLPPGLM